MMTPGSSPRPDAETLLGRCAALDRMADTFRSSWEDIRLHAQPDATPFRTTEERGAPNRHKILDNTMESASQNLAGALAGFMQSGERPFGLRLADTDKAPSDDEAFWLEDTTSRVLTVMNAPQSRYKPVQARTLRTVVDFGTAVKYLTYLPGTGPFFQACPLARTSLALDDRGRIDTVAYRFPLSLRAALKRWPSRSDGRGLSGKTLEAARDPKRQDEEREFVHLVQPRDDWDPRSPLKTKKRYASFWLDPVEKTILDEGGYDRMPYIVPRWSIRDNEIYGRGCGHAALPDAKTLQRIMRSTLGAAELSIRPPLQVPHDGVIGGLRLTEGGINVVRRDLFSRGGDVIRPINTGARADIGEDTAQGVRARIEIAYFNHIIQLSRDPRMTATQVLKLDEETLRVLGPFIGNVQAEDYGPTIESLIALMAERRMLLPPPESLAGRPIEPFYESPIARAQRLGEAQAYAQTFDLAAQYRPDHPEIDDNFDFDGIVRDTVELLGGRRDRLVDPRRVAEKRAARAEAEQAQAGIEAIERLAPAAQSAAQAAQGVAQDNNGRSGARAGEAA